MGPEGPTERSNQSPEGPTERSNQSPEGRTERSKKTMTVQSLHTPPIRTRKDFLVFGTPTIGEAEIEAVVACLPQRRPDSTHSAQGSVRSDPPNEFGGSYQSECRPGGPYGALHHASAQTHRMNSVGRTRASVGPEGRTERSN